MLSNCCDEKENLASSSKGMVDDRYVDCLVATTNKWNKISVKRIIFTFSPVSLASSASCLKDSAVLWVVVL